MEQINLCMTLGSRIVEHCVRQIVTNKALIRPQKFAKTRNSSVTAKKNTLQIFSASLLKIEIPLLPISVHYKKENAILYKIIQNYN